MFKRVRQLHTNAVGGVIFNTQLQLHQHVLPPSLNQQGNHAQMKSPNAYGQHELIYSGRMCPSDVDRLGVIVQLKCFL